MSSVNDSTSMFLIKSSCYGLARGVCMNLLLHPCDVVKIRQQCAEDPEKIRRTVSRILKQEGYQAFYQGLSAQLMSTCLKQIWVWPMITGIPRSLGDRGIQGLRKEFCTALVIATIDALVSTPLEAGKIVSASTGKSEFSLIQHYKNGWRGFFTNWARLSTIWGTFLPVQKLLRDRALARLEPEQNLSAAHLTIIGTEAAMVVTLVSAPIDMANTLNLAKKVAFSEVFSKKAMVRSMRVWPIDFFSKVVHNTGSAFVFDLLDRKKS